MALEGFEIHSEWQRRCSRRRSHTLKENSIDATLDDKKRERANEWLRTRIVSKYRSNVTSNRSRFCVMLNADDGENKIVQAEFTFDPAIALNQPESRTLKSPYPLRRTGLDQVGQRASKTKTINTVYPKYELETALEYDSDSTMASASDTPKNGKESHEHSGKGNIISAESSYTPGIDRAKAKKRVQFFLTSEQEGREVLRTSWIGNRNKPVAASVQASGKANRGGKTAPSFATLLLQAMCRKFPCVTLSAAMRGVD
jgi:hypothetical protein